MATIRRGSTATGHLVWGVPTLIQQEEIIHPVPPPTMSAKATIQSFDTPIQVGQPSRAVAQITQGTPQQFRWQWQDGGVWKTGATNPATDLDHSYNRPNPPNENVFPGAGKYPIRLQTLINGAVVDQTGSLRVIDVQASPIPPEPGPPQPPTPGPGEVVIHATDARTGYAIQGADAWSQLDPATKEKTDANGYAVINAASSGVCILKEGYHSPGLPGQQETCKPIAPGVIELALEAIPPPPPPVPLIHTAGKIFRTATNEAWRYKGVSQFKLCNRFERGEDIQPVFDAYRGYNVLRVWAYTDWADTGWEPSPVNVTQAFFDRCANEGFYVEYTLLTNDSQARSNWARDYVAQLAEGHPHNVLIEGRNEPETHSQSVSTQQLKPALDASGFIYASGNYEVSAHAFGPYLVAHTARDSEWPRRCHNLMEYFNGGGPHKLSDPSHKVPCLGDEPAKMQDVAAPKPPLTKADDWRAYFGGCALLGAGATFHSETGKWGLPPTPEEAELAKAALEGLDAFPADAPLGAYSRPSDSSLRTYVVGHYMVRIRPTTPNPPLSGFTRIGASNILWRR